MPSPPYTRIFDFAETLRDQVIDIYADASVTLPERRLVVEGQVALDCELLAVSLARGFRGGSGAPIEPLVPQRCASVRAVEFHVWIIRCASTPQEDGQPPTVATVESFAQPIYTDAWLLVAGIQERAVNGDLGVVCNDLLVGELRVHGPEGGFGGVDLTVEWTVN